MSSVTDPFSQYDPSQQKPSYTEFGARPERLPEPDPHRDEYGLTVPHKSYTEQAADFWKPDEDDAWYSQIGKGLGMAATAPYAHLADAVNGGPILGEIGHGEEVNRYQQQRAAAEEAAAAEAQKMYSPEEAVAPEPICPAENPYEHMSE
jgi:hypothetical protein